MAVCCAPLLQRILTAAADDNGEWYLPLTKEQVQKVRDELQNNSSSLDETLLSNAFAYIRKCTEDSFDSMVLLLQKFLQLYAARQLSGSETEGVEGALNAVSFRCEPTAGQPINHECSRLAHTLHRASGGSVFRTARHLLETYVNNITTS